MSQEREQSLTNQKKRKTDEMKKSRSKETKQRKRSEGVLRRDAFSALLWSGAQVFGFVIFIFSGESSQKRCVFSLNLFIYAIAEKIMVSVGAIQNI